MPQLPIARRDLLLSALAACCPLRAGANDSDAEYQVKAAFVCKFGNYVDWPAPLKITAGEPFRIGVLASSAVVEEFRRIAMAASVAGHPVEVKPLGRSNVPEGLHVLFVSRVMWPQAGEVMAGLQGRPVLTVTELDPDGPTGMVNFLVVDDKVRFDILLQPATQSGLKISVRLLGVARRVK